MPYIKSSIVGVFIKIIVYNRHDIMRCRKTMNIPIILVIKNLFRDLYIMKSMF